MTKNVSVLFIFCFISAVGAFWYFGHHRPAQEIQRAEPVEIYKPTLSEPRRVKEPSPVTETPPPSETERNEFSDTSTQSDITGEGFDDNALPASDPGAPAVGTAEVSTAPEQSEGFLGDHPPHEHNDSAKSELREEVAAALASAERTMEKGMVALVQILKSKPVEEQRIMWKAMKESAFTTKNPVTQEQLTPEQAEEVWQMMVNIIKSTGYVLPEGVE